MRRLAGGALDALEFLLRPLRALDGFFQRWVNEAVFFAVRRGARKSTVRYALGVVLVLSMAVGSYVDIRMGVSHGEIVVDALMLALVFTLQELNRFADRRIEDSGRVYVPRSSFPWRLFGYWTIVRYVLESQGVLLARKQILARLDLRPFYFFAWITFEVAWVIALFVEETPPNPPEPSPKRALIPVPVRSSP